MGTPVDRTVLPHEDYTSVASLFLLHHIFALHSVLLDGLNDCQSCCRHMISQSCDSAEFWLSALTVPTVYHSDSARDLFMIRTACYSCYSISSQKCTCNKFLAPVQNTSRVIGAIRIICVIGPSLGQLNKRLQTFMRVFPPNIAALCC